MNLKRALKITGLSVLGLLVLAALTVGLGWWYFHPQITRQDGVLYGKRAGKDLTFDIVRPAHPNGKGVLLMVSGGWKSGPGKFDPWLVAPVLRRGYTVFAVRHVSQPQSTIMGIVEDMHRAVRFIRHHAREYRIDPDRLGVTGGSSGGHLSLMLATRGAAGSPDAADPVDRESSAVQAVAIFYPVTDLLNLGSSTENPGDGGPPKSFVRGFGPQATNPAVWKIIGRDLSPIYHVQSNLPPIFIVHGGADTLTPLDQSERFQAAAREVGRTVDLVVRPGKKHGWLAMVFDIPRFADWFDTYLASGPRGR
ncbi:MAG: alpha/beta hydrolase [Verrucomicrobia bacterium]|nr:alpha/beta hydrolase [Verrucomicrobiota bacterium]MBI3870825.1 alpha/beta hydrolase [Verrucomicrobiota bacterium]